MPFRLEQSSATKALLDLRNTDGGIPAVRSNNESGCWTTADVLYDVLVAGSVTQHGIQQVRDMTDFLLNHQLQGVAPNEPAGGWPLALGSRASTMATGQAVAALQLAKAVLNDDASSNQKIQAAIDQGFCWLDWAQDTATGGWGTEPTAGGEGVRPTILATFYALLAYFERGDTASTPGVVRRAADFIQSLRNAADGSWSARPDLPGDASNTSRSMSILVRSGRCSPDNPIIQGGIEFLLGARKEHGLWEVAQEPFFFADAGGYIHYHQNSICDVVVAFADCDFHEEAMRDAVKWLIAEQQPSKLWHLSSPGWKNEEIQTWSTAEWILALDHAARSYARATALTPPAVDRTLSTRVIRVLAALLGIALVICVLLWIGGGSFRHAVSTIHDWWSQNGWLRYVVGTIVVGGIAVTVIGGLILETLKQRRRKIDSNKKG